MSNKRNPRFYAGFYAGIMPVVNAKNHPASLCFRVHGGLPVQLSTQLYNPYDHWWPRINKFVYLIIIRPMVYPGMVVWAWDCFWNLFRGYYLRWVMNPYPPLPKRDGIDPEEGWVVEYSIIANGGEELWYDQRLIKPIYEQSLEVALDILNKLRGFTLRFTKTIHLTNDSCKRSEGNIRDMRIRNTVTNQIIPIELL